MKKLTIILALMLALASCGAKPDRSLTISGDAADLANTVYFLAGEADASGCRAIYSFDKETMEITDEGTSARSLWAWDGKLYYNQYDSIAELGRGAVMGEYPDMQRFVLTDDVLYYPADDEKTVMWELKKPDRIAPECAFPVFEPDGDWLPVTIEVLDTNGWYEDLETYCYNVSSSFVMYCDQENAMSYNDGTFHVYDGSVFSATGIEIFELILKNEARLEYDGESIVSVAHGMLFARDGDDLRVYLLDTPHSAAMEVIKDAFAEDPLIYVDSYSPVVYAIDTAEMTAEIIFAE